MNTLSILCTDLKNIIYDYLVHTIILNDEFDFSHFNGKYIIYKKYQSYMMCSWAHHIETKEEKWVRAGSYLERVYHCDKLSIYMQNHQSVSIITDHDTRTGKRDFLGHDDKYLYFGRETINRYLPTIENNELILDKKDINSEEINYDHLVLSFWGEYSLFENNNKVQTSKYHISKNCIYKDGKKIHFFDDNISYYYISDKNIIVTAGVHTYHFNDKEIVNTYKFTVLKKPNTISTKDIKEK